jgi:hypothetical protein
MLTLAARGYATESIGFPPTDFKIIDPGTHAPLGRSRYSIASTLSGAVLRGDNHYDSGGSDNETGTLVMARGTGLPLLVEFDHTFFNPDGSILQRAHVDMGSGYATCTDNSASPPSQVSAQLTIPADTWAGASVAIPIQHFLRSGDPGPFHLHIFNCAPTPKIFAIDIQSDPGPAIWQPYGDQALRVEVRPNFGWYNVIIAPFLPRLHAWFNPRDRWGFLGSESARYYKGPGIMIVKVHAVPAPSRLGAQRSATRG